MIDDDSFDTAGDVIGMLRAVQPTHQVALAGSHARASDRITEAADAAMSRTRIGLSSGIAEGGRG